MIEMGSSSLSLCPNHTCYGISVEHLTLDAAAYSINGIYNNYAQDQSYTNDLHLVNLAGAGGTAGLVVNSGANGSGPYSNMNLISSTGSSDLPACIQLNAQTRGVHGVTCIGSTHTAQTAGCSSSGNLAAIYVTAGNNSLDDIHIESFCDGIQVSTPANATANTSNVVISNLVTAQKGGKTSGCGNTYPPTANSVHICGPNASSQQKSKFGQCASLNLVSDVSVFQVTTSAGSSSPITTIDDDVSGTAISPPTGGGSVGIYSLGESGSGGYSRFSTSPSPSGESSNATAVPTWGVGRTAPGSNSACTTPGTLYSNITGSSGNTFYVCTLGLVWSPIPTH